MKTLCQLDYAAGQVRRCPGDTCPFWVDDHCAVAGLWQDFGSDERLTKILTDLRSDLAGRNVNGAVRQFHPPGIA
jgi:hypothetical protein